jgi:hypothetical protein
MSELGRQMMKNKIANNMLELFDKAIDDNELWQRNLSQADILDIIFEVADELKQEMEE